MRARARTYASHACAAGAKKREKNTWREIEPGGRRYREMGTRKGDGEGARGADAGQTATARGWGWMQRGGWRNVFPESLVKWKSITSTLNHLNWFRHGPKARSALLSLSFFYLFFLFIAWRWAMRADGCTKKNAGEDGRGEDKTRGEKYRWGRKAKGEREGEKRNVRNT